MFAQKGKQKLFSTNQFNFPNPKQSEREREMEKNNMFIKSARIYLPKEIPMANLDIDTNIKPTKTKK